MNIFPKTKAEWQIIFVWFAIVSFGEWFFGNLLWDPFVAFLESLGIPRAELITDTFKVALPLVVVVLVIFIHRFLFKKEIERERVRILEEIGKSSVTKKVIHKQKIRSKIKSKQRKEIQTKLDLWEEFLTLAKKCAEVLFLNPTNKEYFELYETFDSGLKIMLGKENPEYTWFLRVSFSGYETHLDASIMFPKSFPEGTLSGLQGLIKTILDCIRYFQVKKPPFTDIDFREFPSKDLKRYIKIFERIERTSIERNKFYYAETPGGILYRIENGRAVHQMNWELANKEGYDGSRDPKIRKISLEELRKYLS